MIIHLSISLALSIDRSIYLPIYFYPSLSCKIISLYLRLEVHKVLRLPRHFHFKVHKVLRLPTTKSALQGPQSTAPATKFALQFPQGTLMFWWLANVLWTLT